MRHTTFVLIFITLMLTLHASAQDYVITTNTQINNDKLVQLQSTSEDTQDLLDTHRIKYRFTTFDGVLADLTPDEYERLKNDPRYTIAPNKEFRIMLDASIPQIDADSAWNLQVNNTNLTGTGQTVCVVDTGVDYTHANLGGCYGNNNASSNCTVIGGYDLISNDDDPLDGNGHGTHTAGIIVSNHATYKGVAPGVKIIAIRSLDDAGNGNSSSVGAGIDWCVANASTFNISVITLSLGELNTYYNTSCGAGDYPVLTPAIQAAIAANITVTISAGNCNNQGGQTCTQEGITGPSCIPGIIPVGAVNDADALQYQRGDLFQVFAPGIGIISTQNGGSTESRSGTSMAAPHVAGLVAILNQLYNAQTGMNMTNATVKAAVNTTDTYINDTSLTGNLYARVSALYALYALDSIAPNATLTSPANETINDSINQTFLINATDLALKNITFTLYNTTAIVNETSATLSGASDSYTTTMYNLLAGEYYWSATVYDQGNNSFTTANATLTISGSTTQNSPANNTYTNTANTNFTCTSKTATTLDLDNVTLMVYNETAQVYNTTQVISGTTNTSIINYTFETEGAYTWHCTSTNNESTTTMSTNYTITYDITAPNVTIITPLPTSETADVATKVFYFNVSDTHPNTSCELRFSGSVQNSSVITNYSQTHNLSKVVTPGNYSWTINCTDFAGNSNISSANTFTITEEGSDDSGGSSGGGGGGATSTTKEYPKGSQQNPYTTTDFASAKRLYMSKNLAVYFTDNNADTHNITVTDITEGIATIIIQSEPQTITLQAGERQKLNLSGPQYYDLEVHVLSMSTDIVTLELTAINEAHKDYIEPVFTIQESEAQEDPNTSDINGNTIQDVTNDTVLKRYLLIGGIILLTLLGSYIVLYLVYQKRHKAETTTKHTKGKTRTKHTEEKGNNETKT